jgi:hypothetical protein
MEAVCICASVRWHKVIRYEEKRHMGSNLILASVPPGRDRLKRLLT